MVYHNSPKTFLSKALFIALIFVVTLAFFPLLADPAYAASGKSAKKKTSKADVRVINLNAEISTKGQKGEKDPAHRPAEMEIRRLQNSHPV